MVFGSNFQSIQRQRKQIATPKRHSPLRILNIAALHPANVSKKQNFRNLCGSIAVILYMLKQVSTNRNNDMIQELTDLVDHYSKFPAVKNIIENISGILKNLKNPNRNATF